MKRILILLLAGVLCVSVMTACSQKEEEAEATPIVIESVTQAPQPVQESVAPEPTPDVAPTPEPLPTPEATPSVEPTPLPAVNEQGGAAIVTVAKEQVGKPYEKGGKGPDNFDASGLVYYVLKTAGTDVKYMTSADWANASYPSVTGMNEMQPGDVAVFQGSVGIYLGDYKMITASSSSGQVVESSNINDSDYWVSNFICGKRVA